MNPAEPPAQSAPFAARLGLGLLDLSLLVALCAMPVIWLFNTLSFEKGGLEFSATWGAKTLLIPLALLAVRLGWRNALRRRHPGARGPADSAVYKKFCLAWLPAFLLLFALEWVAQRAGIEPLGSAPIVIVGEEHLDTHVEDNKIVKDPELLWAFQPGYKWEYVWINRHGFRTREFTAEKPAGTRRVICLGDSCTAQGRPPYSDRLHERLQQAPPTDQPWEAFNTGVYGYSVLQGYRQFLKHGRHYQPDVVTIYFGWNSHWLHEKPDHERLAVRMNRVSAATVEALRGKRLYGLLARLARRPSQTVDVGGRTLRVPLDRYARTLADLIAEVRQAGAIPIVLTAPRREVAPGGNHPPNANELHDQYVETTRQVARETGADLLDLAALFAAPECDPLFLKDGIHFTEDGLQKIADLLHGRLQEMAAAGRFD